MVETETRSAIDTVIASQALRVIVARVGVIVGRLMNIWPVVVLYY